MHTKLNKLYNRFKSNINKNNQSDMDSDYLVDYEEPVKKRTRKISKESITKQLDKCKNMIVKKNSHLDSRCANAHFNYTLEYTEKGTIKRPTYYVQSTGDIYYIPITMDVIRSLVLKQHCKITKQEEIEWFEDGLKWLSQQQYQNNSNSNSNNTFTTNNSNQYRYYIEEEGNYYDEKKDVNQIREMEDLERACEAYFGIPLGLCENSWAAEYLINQASKGKLLRRVTLQPSLRKVSFSLKKLWCF